MLFITKESDININCDLCCIYFYTLWVPYHKKMMIMINKVEQKHKIKFYAVDADSFITQCKRFNISSVPTVIIIKDGREIKRINGMVLTSAFKSAFADICNSSDHINMEIDNGKER